MAYLALPNQYIPSPGVTVPSELQAIRPQLLEEYVRARLGQFVGAFSERIVLLSPAVTPEIVHRAVEDVLSILPPPEYRNLGLEQRDLQLVFRHDCLALGCLDPQCALCQHNPNRRCMVNFDRKYLVNDVLKAKCCASIRVELIDRATGLLIEDDVPDMRLEICVLDGNLYDVKFLEGGQLVEGGSEPEEDLVACALLLNKKKNTPLLVCGAGGNNDTTGGVSVTFVRGKALLPDLHVTDSSEAILSGRKPPFRLLVTAVQPDGSALHIRHAVSEGFVVATRRTRTAGKADIPSVDDHVSKLEHMGKETVKKLQDIRTAGQQHGIEIEIPENCVQKVGEFKQLALRADQDGHLRQKLQHVLKLSKEKWEEARDHAMRAVVADNRMRAWYADRRNLEMGLLFTCRLGGVDLDRPVGLLQNRNEGNEAKVEATLLAQQTPAQREVLRTLQPRAINGWWSPGHLGWAIFPMDSEQFLASGSLTGGTPTTSDIPSSLPRPPSIGRTGAGAQPEAPSHLPLHLQPGLRDGGGGGAGGGGGGAGPPLLAPGLAPSQQQLQQAGMYRQMPQYPGGGASQSSRDPSPHAHGPGGGGGGGGGMHPPTRTAFEPSRPPYEAQTRTPFDQARSPFEHVLMPAHGGGGASAPPPSLPGPGQGGLGGPRGGGAPHPSSSGGTPQQQSHQQQSHQQLSPPRGGGGGGGPPFLPGSGGGGGATAGQKRGPPTAEATHASGQAERQSGERQPAQRAFSQPGSESSRSGGDMSHVRAPSSSQGAPKPPSPPSPPPALPLPSAAPNPFMSVQQQQPRDAPTGTSRVAPIVHALGDSSGTLLNLDDLPSLPFHAQAAFHAAQTGYQGGLGHLGAGGGGNGGGRPGGMSNGGNGGGAGPSGRDGGGGGLGGASARELMPPPQQMGGQQQRLWLQQQIWSGMPPPGAGPGLQHPLAGLNQQGLGSHHALGLHPPGGLQQQQLRGGGGGGGIGGLSHHLMGAPPSQQPHHHHHHHHQGAPGLGLHHQPGGGAGGGGPLSLPLQLLPNALGSAFPMLSEEMLEFTLPEGMEMSNGSLAGFDLTTDQILAHLAHRSVGLGGGGGGGGGNGHAGSGGGAPGPNGGGGGGGGYGGPLAAAPLKETASGLDCMQSIEQALPDLEAYAEHVAAAQAAAAAAALPTHNAFQGSLPPGLRNDHW